MRNFFKSDTKESMSRLIAAFLAVNGCGAMWYMLLKDKPGSEIAIVVSCITTIGGIYKIFGEINNKNKTE